MGLCWGVCILTVHVCVCVYCTRVCVRARMRFRVGLQRVEEGPYAGNARVRVLQVAVLSFSCCVVVVRTRDSWCVVVLFCAFLVFPCVGVFVCAHSNVYVRAWELHMCACACMSMCLCAACE